MAAMSTALTDYSDNGDARTYTTSGHSIQKPKLVLQRRRTPVGNQTIAEDTISVLHGTENADGDYLAARVLLTVTLRRPIDGISGDVDAALVILRDIVASDELGAVLSGQAWLA